MPLGAFAGRQNGIMYNAATKKVVQSPTATTGAVGSSPSTGVMSALGEATRGGAAGVYDRFKAKQSAQPVAAAAQPAGFNYDPTADPIYQKALAAAKANAQVQQGNDIAALNKRGLLGSDAGNAEIAQIGQNAVSDLEANLLPQLSQQAYNRYRDDINQKNQDEQLAVQKGQLTGYYDSPEMSKAYADVNQAKQDWANAKTLAERNTAHAKAVAARNVIAQLGGNAGLVGSNVTLGQAQANQGKYGVKTAAETDAEWNRTHTTAREAIDDKRYTDETSYSHGRDSVADKRYDAETAYTHGRDKVADAQWKQEFQDRVKQEGIDNAMSWANYSLSKSNSAKDDTRQDNNTAYGRLMDIWQATGIAPKGIDGVQPGTPYGVQKAAQPASYEDAYKDIDSSMYVQPEINADGDKTGRTTVTNPGGLADYIFSLGLSETDTKKLYQRYGLKWGG